MQARNAAHLVLQVSTGHELVLILTVQYDTTYDAYRAAYLEESRSFLSSRRLRAS